MKRITIIFLVLFTKTSIADISEEFMKIPKKCLQESYSYYCGNGGCSASEDDIPTKLSKNEKANCKNMFNVFNKKQNGLYEGSKLFLDCDFSYEQVVEIQKQKPIKKEEGRWIYTYNKTILGIPMIAFGTGVCDSKGEIECGAGSYHEFISNLSVAEAQKLLRDNYGDDFTVEERNDTTGGTSRPILVKSNSGIGKSSLYCDGGSI